MATIINKTEETLTQLEAQNKVHIMNSKDDMSIINAINENMEDVRREYQVKDRNSQHSAASVVLTA